MLLIIAIATAFVAYAQAPQTPAYRQVAVTVTDPHHRFVTGLDRDHFEVVDNGTQRAISGFADVDSPITVAIVSDAAEPALDRFNSPNDVLIQTKSLPDALRQLAAATTPRKALVITTPVDSAPVSIPAGIQVIRTEAAQVSRWLIELRNQYVLQLQGDAPPTGITVAVKAPKGLPALQAHWK